MADETLRTSPETPVLRIRPPRRWRLPDLAGIWRYRELLWVFGVRDVTLRFRQTIAGSVWIVAGPLLSAGVFSFVFGRVAKLDSEGIPYLVFSYAGLVAWTAFSTTITKASGSLLANANVITKVYFPRLVLPFATVFGTLTNLLVTFAMLVVLMVAYGLPLTWHLVLLPLTILLVLMLGLGVAAVLAAGSVFFRDVAILTPTVVSLLLYVSPVAYGTSSVPADVRTLYLLNPLASLVELWRWSIFGTGTFYAWSVAFSVVATVAVFTVGLVLFTRMEPRFTDVI